MTTVQDIQEQNKIFKLFAPVARATNAIYMYVREDATWASVKAPNHFNSKNLSGSVKPGDIIICNIGAPATSTFGILRVTAVNPTAGTITTAVATLGT